MNIRNITDGIYYSGTNDRITERFESMWPLPLGVSYNSYVVEGSEKVALMDTVRIETVREYISQLEEILSGKDVDYLVIHHMEPDHSGSIPEVLSRWPNLKIVGNSQTISMVKGFHICQDDSRFVTVKDQDTIDLGGITLKFVMTPMVHWPETMMTYVEERNLLFSGDAFGCFGALNGAVVDSQMDVDRYWPEMYRYYSNIVGKYGKFVQKALDKLKDVKLDYICSTHGPVWHDNIEKVIKITDSLSNYQSESGVTIVYGSMYGNTGEIAEEIAVGLAENGVKNIRIHNVATSSMSDIIADAFRYKGLVVGSATYSMGLMPRVQEFLEAMKVREIKGKVLAGFSGYTWAAGPVANAINEFAGQMGLELAGILAMKQNIDSSMREAARGLGRSLASQLE